MSKGSKRRARAVDEDKFYTDWFRIFDILHNDSLLRRRTGVQDKVKHIRDESDNSSGDGTSKG